MSSNNFQNIIDYIKNESRGFNDAPFNPVDALIMSVLSYCHFDGYVPSPDDSKGAWVELGSLADENIITAMTYRISNRENRRELLKAAIESPRFSPLKMNYYVHNTDDLMEKQFSAITYKLPDKTLFIAFRGTDNTLTGWRENFNMAYLNTVPAQQAAASYLCAVISASESIMPWKRISGIRLGGHSKGGNLAVYAAMNCIVNEREHLLDVYSFDGPGFKKNVFDLSEFKAIGSRVHLYLPQDSMIGTLLIQSNDYEVVSSSASGFDEHDPFSWKITGSSFVNESDLSPKAKKFNDLLDRWMEGLSDDKRSLLVRTLFEMVDSTDAQSFSDVMEMIQHRDWTALKALRNVPPDERRDLIGMILALARTYKEIYKEDKKAGKK